MRSMDKMKSAVLDLLFPIKCLGCGIEYEDLEPKKRWICESCLLKVPLRRVQTCPVCEQFSESGKTHFKCRKRTVLNGLWVASEYQNKTVSEAIKKLKFSFVKDLAFPISRVIIRSIVEVEEFGDFHDSVLSNYLKMDDEEKYANKEMNKKRDTIVIPVPLHRKRLNWRGFNQAELLSCEIAEKFGLEVAKDAIARIKNTRPQTKVDTFARRKMNLKRAFYTQKPLKIKNKNVIIVDDVSTTLATMNECAKAAKSAGANSIWGLVAARR